MSVHDEAEKLKMPIPIIKNKKVIGTRGIDPENAITFLEKVKNLLASIQNFFKK